jgi:serine/threonine protein kinase/Tfp pilus assembly protein PilF
MSASTSDSATIVLGTGPLSGPPGLAAAGPLAAGSPFGSRYRILRELGAGGMGVVYQAWDAELGVAVALKVVRPEVNANPEVAQAVERRFKRELLLARQVTHKHVVRIHDLGEIDGIKYITMPYVEGEDLATVLRRDGRVPTERALKIAKQVASGLQAAHEAGVVHRDLKPANIMIDADENALIMDFGIALSAYPSETHAVTDASGSPSLSKAAAEGETFLGNASITGAEIATRGGTLLSTSAGAIVGTLEYMAPEQARGQPVDHRADIYAYGLIVSDMLTGSRKSEPGASPLDQLNARVSTPPQSLRASDETIPEPVDALVVRCLQLDPAVRFQTTDELAAALDRLDAKGNLLPVLRRVSTRQIVAAAIMTGILLTGTWWLSRTPLPPAAHPSVSVLIADFQNRTGDRSFEGSVEQALAITMEGAPFITSYNRVDARKLAEKLKPGSTLDERMAQVISAREGIKYILAGTIEAAGPRVQIAIKALDPADGHAVATATGNAATKSDVLKTVGTLAVQLRRALGDTTPKSVSLAAMDPVTTVSLEALQAYARGQDLALAGKSQEAVTAFEDAVRLDPSLGRAYVQMAVIHGNLKRDRLAEENFQKALKYIDRMTEREKYRTLGSYYFLVAHNYEKAIENYETLVRLYPADNSGHANLAFADLLMGNLDKAVSEGRKAIEIYPRNLLQRTNYAMYAMYAGDFKTSILEANTVLRENPQFDYAILTVARATLATGDLEGARAAYRRLRAVSAFGASLANLGEADIAMYLGRYREAVSILTAGIAADEKAGNASDAAPHYVALAEAHLALGAREAAGTAALKATTLSRQQSVLFPAARVLIELGRKEDASKIAGDLENMLQRQTIAYARALDGELSLKNNRLASALETLRDSQKRYDSWFAHYLLGRTYFDARHFPEALQELEWCFQHKGLATDVFIADSATLRYFPPVQYWLARAQESLGAVDAARRNYQEFVSVRATADSPDPLAADARVRAGRLPVK